MMSRQRASHKDQPPMSASLTQALRQALPLWVSKLLQNWRRLSKFFPTGLSSYTLWRRSFIETPFFGSYETRRPLTAPAL